MREQPAGLYIHFRLWQRISREGGAAIGRLMGRDRISLQGGRGAAVCVWRRVKSDSHRVAINLERANQRSQFGRRLHQECGDQSAAHERLAIIARFAGGLERADIDARPVAATGQIKRAEGDRFTGLRQVSSILLCRGCIWKRSYLQCVSKYTFSRLTLNRLYQQEKKC